MGKRAGGKRRKADPNPKIVFGLAFLILIGGGILVYFANQRSIADLKEHPRLNDFVTDHTALLTRADHVAMEDRLDRLNRDGGAQVAVFILPALTKSTIAEEALDLARRYRIGHAGKNDGALLLIADREKQARIEVGYGLEATLTDAMSRVIIANEIEPYLQKGETSAAARHGVDAILAIVHPAPFVEPVAEPLGVGWYAGVGLFMLVIALVVVGFIQAILLAIPGVRARLIRSRHWGWFARIRIIGGGGASTTDDKDSTSSSTGSSDGGGSFGGGGANN